MSGLPTVDEPSVAAGVVDRTGERGAVVGTDTGGAGN